MALQTLFLELRLLLSGLTVREYVVTQPRYDHPVLHMLMSSPHGTWRLQEMVPNCFGYPKRVRKLPSEPSRKQERVVLGIIHYASGKSGLLLCIIHCASGKIVLSIVHCTISSYSHTVLVERVAYCSSLYIVPFHHILCIMCFPFSCLCNVSYCSLFLTVLMELSGKILSSSFN